MGVTGPFIAGDTYASTDDNTKVAEINNAVTGANQSVNTGDNSQLIKGISQYSSVGDFYEESGGSAADVYLLQPVSPRISIFEYVEGMRIRFLVVNTNTGASTININSVGVKNIKLSDGTTDPNPGLINAGDYIELIYDGTSFKISKVIEEFDIALGNIISGGASVDITNLSLLQTKRFRFQKSVNGGVSNIVLFSIDKLATPSQLYFSLSGRINAQEGTSALDLADWDFNLTGNVQASPVSAFNTINLALLNQNINLQTDITFNLNSSSNKIEVRASNAGANQVQVSGNMELYVVAVIP